MDVVSNWKLIAAAVLLLVGFCGGFTFEKKRWPAKEQALIQEQREICARNQAITQEAAHDLQTKLTNTNARLAADLKRLRSFNVPAPGPAGEHDGVAGRDGLSQQDRSDDLLTLGAAADKQTAQLVACQSFVRKVWEMNR